ncbi:MAG: UDP-glucose 4-epimerase GalE [Candidatus Puniceispirillaceae bacterium]
MKILVTGGAGYIGTHTLLPLLQADHDVCVLDNFSNASPEALRRVGRLSNKSFDQLEGSITDSAVLSEIMNNFQPEAVIHFAGLKAVGESEVIPLRYYAENVFGTIQLLDAMDQIGCKQIVFSSSATVYGVPDYLPYDEAHPLKPVNPYGRTKYFIEEIIRDWAATDQEKSAVLLRYFNPVGNDRSGMIGEDPMGIPNNLMPYIAQVAVGRRDKLMVYGNDYDTIDGTGVRDYIHVSDLADGHVSALSYAATHTGVEAFNLGAGKGYSVLEVVQAFEKASGQAIPYEIASRRKGDIDEVVANPAKAKNLLGWEARLGIDEMCADVWHWQSKNPKGYRN